MFESGESLRTYVVDVIPDDEQYVETVRIGDHRSAWLNIEGPLTRDRGHATRIASGAWSGEFADNETQAIQLTFDNDSRAFAGEVWQLDFTSQDEELQLRFRRE